MNRGTVIVTCGPASEMLDEVRRITNHSTGQLGVHLTHRLVQEGFRVVCCRSQDSLIPEEEFLAVSGEVELETFRTNGDLKQLFATLSHHAHGVEAVFHAAALCDFSVVTMIDSNGNPINPAKISSREGDIVLRLRPSEKLINHLRDWFPESLLVGWKYELEGTREEVIAKGILQIEENATDGCVLNGRAFGPGFGFYREGHELAACEDGAILADVLTRWLVTEVHPEKKVPLVSAKGWRS